MHVPAGRIDRRLLPADLLNANAASTVHDKSVSSVSLDQGAARHLRNGIKDGELDLDLVNAWLSKILQTAGNDVFRMKGILAVKYAKRRFVYHSVHMIFNGGFEEPWAEGEPRQSKMVFIGRNLNAKEMGQAFNACLATPANLDKKKAALRFDVGDRVECNCGGWAPGTVVAQLYRDEKMAPGFVAPYQIQLDMGRLIWAPKDDDRCIRMLIEEVEGEEDEEAMDTEDAPHTTTAGGVKEAHEGDQGERHHGHDHAVSLE